MKTGTAMLWLLTLLPWSLGQDSASSKFFSNSLIPGISAFPFDDSLGENPFGEFPSFSQSPTSAPPFTQDGLDPKKFRPLQPGFQFPAQPSYLPPYKYQPNSIQPQPLEPSPFQPTPAQPSQNHKRRPPSSQPNTASEEDRITPEEILAFLYRIGKPQNSQDQTGSYSAASTYQPNERNTGNVSPSQKPLCQAFLSQYVCTACLPNKPCKHYCC